jgi:hypothetical protein
MHARLLRDYRSDVAPPSNDTVNFCVMVILLCQAMLIETLHFSYVTSALYRHLESASATSRAAGAGQGWLGISQKWRETAAVAEHSHAEYVGC